MRISMGQSLHRMLHVRFNFFIPHPLEIFLRYMMSGWLVMQVQRQTTELGGGKEALWGVWGNACGDWLSRRKLGHNRWNQYARLSPAEEAALVGFFVFFLFLGPPTSSQPLRSHVLRTGTFSSLIMGGSSRRRQRRQQKLFKNKDCAYITTNTKWNDFNSQKTEFLKGHWTLMPSVKKQTISWMN